MHILKSFFHSFVQFLVNLVFRPEIVAGILDLFIVADGHATGVTKNVWNHVNIIWYKIRQADVVRIRLYQILRSLTNASEPG